MGPSCHRKQTEGTGVSTWRGKSLLTNRAAWVHEFLPEQVAAASSLVYEVDYRFDYRRTVATGELPALPAEADGNDWWRWSRPIRGT